MVISSFMLLPWDEWQVEHQANMKFFLTLSISNDWSVLVLIFFNVMIPSFELWTMLYLKFYIKYAGFCFGLFSTHQTFTHFILTFSVFKFSDFIRYIFRNII